MGLQSFDVLVLGGGLVGLATANLCAKQGFSVGVIEINPPNFHWSREFDLRCSAVSRRSQKMFEVLGLWEVLEPISPYRRMVVWDAMGFGEISFDAVEVGEPNLGHIVENRLMIKALWEQAQADPLIELCVGQKPIALKVDVLGAEVELEDQRVLQAKLIIGADGKNSWVREAVGISVNRKNYHQEALVATVETENSHEQTAWQRFLEPGPLAFLPFSKPRLSTIVWTTTVEKMLEIKALKKEAFYEELAHAFDYRLGKILWSSDYQSFPLERLHAKHYVKERVALVGDAVHVVHPLAGQGVNLGFHGASRLVEVLVEAREKKADIGHLLSLRPYERSHKSYIVSAMAAMDFLKNTFGVRSDFFCDLRSFGLEMVNRFPVVKKQMIKQAMGI